jgi:hypothetical protein
MESIPLNEIYQQKLNFLIGAGASDGLFPTLWLAIKDSENPMREETIETLATKLDQKGKKHHHTLLFMYYFKNIIQPVCDFDKYDSSSICFICPQDESCNCKNKVALKNYGVFIDSIVRLLQHKKEYSKRCNIFTTNYDGCIPFAADKLIKKGDIDFVVNDGSSGFFEKTLSAKNFNRYICQSGAFDKYSTDIPQLNYINLHGSAYWRNEDENIKVDYTLSEISVTIPEEAQAWLGELDAILNDASKTTEDVLKINVEFSDEVLKGFWTEYNKLPIVNPTKWKFHETVFEEHYYQMLRLLSYQLEEPNSVLISFAFSFADEHILKLVKRSLSNPKLQVFVCCFNESERAVMSERFNGYRNVEIISLDGRNLDFSAFNEVVFNADLIRDVIK